MEGNIFENFTQRQQVSKAENTSDKQHSPQSWPLIESIRKKRQKNSHSRWVDGRK